MQRKAIPPWPKHVAVQGGLGVCSTDVRTFSAAVNVPGRREQGTFGLAAMRFVQHSVCRRDAPIKGILKTSGLLSRPSIPE
jgi:hypothetical protein